jgi:hypothetical protein
MSGDLGGGLRRKHHRAAAITGWSHGRTGIPWRPFDPKHISNPEIPIVPHRPRGAARHLITEASMERDRTPTEARGGVISGRVIVVLLASLSGAVIAMAAIWYFFFGPGMR